MAYVGNAGRIELLLHLSSVHIHDAWLLSTVNIVHLIENQGVPSSNQGVAGSNPSFAM